MDKKRIIVIDDERTICEAIEFLLENEGYDVITAYNGEEGLQQVYKFPPDMLIVDLLMPKMNGFRVVKRVRNDPAFKEIPILMLTVVDDKLNIEEGYSSGVTDYMVKPFEVDDLLARVRTLLE